MENILKKIVDAKRSEVEHLKKIKPLQTSMINEKHYSNYSLKKFLSDPEGTGIIAEFKRRSPSKGNININSDIVRTTTGYISAGASALSILTEKNFFEGCNEDIISARAVNSCPILRKEFIIDEYQLIESKLIGADAILLIAAILTPDEAYKLASQAREIGLEVLMEVHSEEEISLINEYVDIAGINNRNLNDFSLSLDTSLELFDMIPEQFIKISESGIDSPEKLLMLKQKGFKGFLMGERFMSHEYPEIACKDFIKDLKKLSFYTKETINEN